MCLFQSPLLLPLMFLIVVSPFLAYFLYYKVAKRLLSGLLSKPYVRWAVAMSFVGILVLSALSFFNGWGKHYSDSQRLVGARIRSVSESFGKTDIPHPETACEDIYFQYWNISFLLDCQWFLDNFGNFVVLPTGAILAIGYINERSKQAKFHA